MARVVVGCHPSSGHGRPRRVVKTGALRFLTGAVGVALLDLDFIWGLGNSVAGWTLRATFWALQVWLVFLTRIRISLRLPPDTVTWTRCWSRQPLQRVLLAFTKSELLVFDRSVWRGAVASPIRESPYSEVGLILERRGALFDWIRCEWPDGTVMRVRLHRGQALPLAAALLIPHRLRRGPVARAADWLRAGTQY